MAVKRPANVLLLDEGGERARARCIDLAHVFTELGRDVRELERAIEVLLGFAVDQALCLSANVRGAELGEAVFVQAPAEPLGKRPNLDIVLLAPGEIRQGEGVL